MTMSPRLRKLALTAHVVSSVGWLGAALAYGGLVAAALGSGDDDLVRAACSCLGPLTWFALVPLALTALLTGVIQALGTRWGLFRHYWVLFKLVLTVAAGAVLLANTRSVEALSAGTMDPAGAGTRGLLGQLIHAAGGVLVLLVTTILAVYKPRGTTRYGWRKQHEQSLRTKAA